MTGGGGAACTGGEDGGVFGAFIFNASNQNAVVFGGRENGVEDGGFLGVTNPIELMP